MRRYGRYYTAERKNQCIAEVSDEHGWNRHQCTRPRGHGPEGLYCKQHGRMVDEGRQFYVPKDAAEGEGTK